MSPICFTRQDLSTLKNTNKKSRATKETPNKRALLNEKLKKLLLKGLNINSL